MAPYLRRLWFRFGFLFIGLSLGPQAVGVLPGFGWLGNWYYDQAWPWAAPWIGRLVFHLNLPEQAPFNGSGDRIEDWLQLAAILGLSLIGGLIWAGFDRGRRADGILGELLRILLRYDLALIMLNYGVSKVLHQQMPPPRAVRLLEPYGESSPMGMLWAFMGQSAAYSAFTGGLEMLGGLLLLFRPTATLGALLIAAIMLNVALLNFCFDVPVKIYSVSLLVYALVLIAPDARRLAAVLIWHRPTVGAVLSPSWSRGRGRTIHGWAKAAVACWFLWVGPGSRVWNWVSHPPPASDPIDGIYQVIRFTEQGKLRPPLTTDAGRWYRIGIDLGSSFTIQYMNGDRRVYRLVRSGADHWEIRESARATPKPRVLWAFICRPEDNGDLTLAGQSDLSDPLTVVLHRNDSAMLLRNRGFHWISPAPFNR
jgi:uncharacterized membrane protein YphA (DoxX/SURF4 family)